MSTRTLVIPARFSGPPGSGNGGWVAGTLAGFLPAAAGGAVTVRLAAPAPLDTLLDVVPDPAVDGAGVRLERAGAVLATAAVVDPDAAVPAGPPDEFVDHARAVTAAAGYPGPTEHPFPSCVVCSPTHPDGLRLTPARPPGGPAGTTATGWLPAPWCDAGDGSAGLPSVWAALDCPGGWTSDVRTRPVLLGTATTAVLRRPRIGEPCVLVGTARGEQGRKVFASTSLFTADGDLLARSTQVWIRVPVPTRVPARPPAG